MDALNLNIHALDYVVLFSVIVITMGIGVYSVLFRKNKSTEDYILGGRKLTIFPVAFSLIATAVSDFTLQGAPSEIYFNGLGYYYACLTEILLIPVVYTSFLPVFHNSKITTVNEYLELRFCKSLRTLCGLIYLFQCIFYIPAMMELSALAVTQVFGFAFPAVVIISGAVMILYTAFGGIRAVVWTDVVQTVFMLMGILALAVRGTMDQGGIKSVLERNYNGERITIPKFGVDFEERYGFWAILFGMTIQQTAFVGLNMGSVQRYLSVPTLQSAQRALVMTVIGYLVFISLSSYIGLLAYAEFYNCDPLTSNIITSRDEIVPLLFMNTFGSTPGVSGLFAASIISANFSSVSTALNALSALVLEDLYKTYINKNIEERTANIIMILTVFVLGSTMTALVFFTVKYGTVVQRCLVFTSYAGGVVYFEQCFALIGGQAMRSAGTFDGLQVLVSTNGVATGVVFAIFSIGVFLPWIKSTPTLIGSIAGLFLSLWIHIGSEIMDFGEECYGTKPLSVAGCEHNYTIANMSFNCLRKDRGIYGISLLWYSVIGFVVTFLGAVSLSLIMETNDVTRMDKALVSPLVLRYLRERQVDLQQGNQDEAHNP